MKKVGILGGTFNPPHIGHLLMASEVREVLELDEVRLMPNAQPPHKEMSKGETNEQRLEMVKLAVAPYEYLTYEPYEIEVGGISYTYKTMQALCQREPDVKFYFIVGGDMIDSLHTWHHIEELLQMVTFVGVARPGAVAHTELPIMMVEVPQLEISSTFIRNRLATGGTVHFLLTEPVLAYIKEEGLYGTCSVASSH